MFSISATYQTPPPGAPPTCSIWFHPGLLHIILDERSGIFESYYEAPYLCCCLPSAYWVCRGAYGQPDFEETKRLAEQGHASAQYNLGLMYVNGEGVPQNNVRAYVWWSVALGLEEARANRDRVTGELTPEQLARGQDMATRCFESDFQDCE